MAQEERREDRQNQRARKVKQRRVLVGKRLCLRQASQHEEGGRGKSMRNEKEERNSKLESQGSEPVKWERAQKGQRRRAATYYRLLMKWPTRKNQKA